MKNRSRIAETATLFEKVLTTAAIIALAMVGLAEPAAAKGPASITITGPGIDGPIELIETVDTDQLRRLMEQSGVWYATGDLPAPLGEKPTGELGPSYMLTWVILGPPGTPEEERTIRQLIYPQAENGPIIHTQEVPEGWGQEVLGWFAAPPTFTETLTSLGTPLTEASFDQPNWNGPLFALLIGAAIGILVWRLLRFTPMRRSGVTRP